MASMIWMVVIFVGGCCWGYLGCWANTSADRKRQQTMCLKCRLEKMKQEANAGRPFITTGKPTIERIDDAEKNKKEKIPTGQDHFPTM